MSQRPQKLSASMANQSSFFGGQPTTFHRAHPRVSKLRVTVQEHAQSQQYDAQEYDETDIPPMIDCSNPHCWGGGFHLKPMLDEAMINKWDNDKPIQFEELLPCIGHEGTRTRTDRRCYHAFVVKVLIEYKNESNRSVGEQK
jgi:hypothetical protein